MGAEDAATYDHPVLVKARVLLYLWGIQQVLSTRF